MKQKKKNRKAKHTTATKRKRPMTVMAYAQDRVFLFGNQKGIYEMGCKATGKTGRWMGKKR